MQRPRTILGSLSTAMPSEAIAYSVNHFDPRAILVQIEVAIVALIYNML